MPIIEIKRKKQFADYIRAYEIFVDDEKINKIRAGESVSFNVNEGRHWIVLKIDWCQSNVLEVNLRGEEKIVLECGNNTKPFLELYYVLFAPKEYLWLKRVSNNEL